MRYLLLIHTDPAAQPPTPEAWSEMMAEYNAFGEWAAGKGWLLGGEALQDPSLTTVVRVRDGATAITDGPFAETKEQLGGYYLIDAPDLDGAIEAAERIPGARAGAVEIRPIMEMG